MKESFVTILNHFATGLFSSFFYYKTIMKSLKVVQILPVSFLETLFHTTANSKTYVKYSSLSYTVKIRLVSYIILQLYWEGKHITYAISMSQIHVNVLL